MYSIRNYGEMILDAARMDAYTQALRRAIRPGAVVLDIGTGTGIFALLASRFGARRVFAVESADAIHVAREIASANGCSETIEFFQAMSTQITLPERADVIISDLRGILPFYGSHLIAIQDATARHLAPGGVMIPSHDTLWVAAIDSPPDYRRLDASWTSNPYDLDMTAARKLAVNSFLRMKIEDEQIVAGPACCGTLDYANLRGTDFAADVRLPVSRAGTAHGLCVWFDSTMADDIRLSNGPGGPGLIYGNAFFPWPSRVALESGDTIAISLRADLVGDSYVWGWNTLVLNAGSGDVKVEFKQSEFYGEPLSSARLRKRAAGHVVELNEDGRIDGQILALMDRGKPLGDIAGEMVEAFPRRFARWEDALNRVGELSLRYGR